MSKEINKYYYANYKALQEEQGLFKKSIQKIDDFYKEKGMNSGTETLPFFLQVNIIKKDDITTFNNKIKIFNKILTKIAQNYIKGKKSPIKLSKKEDELVKIPSGI